jgi:hypothetical protein
VVFLSRDTLAQQVVTPSQVVEAEAKLKLAMATLQKVRLLVSACCMVVRRPSLRH